MITLLRTFLDICLLRSGPQTLPASRSLLGAAIAAHLTMNGLHGLLGLEPDVVAASAALGTATVAAVVQALLLLARRSARTLQTLTAMTGCESFLGLFALPASLLFYDGGQSAFAALVILGFILWNLLIAAHVFRHALDVSLQSGMLLSMGYILFTYSIVELAVEQGG